VPTANHPSGSLAPTAGYVDQGRRRCLSGGTAWAARALLPAGVALGLTTAGRAHPGPGRLDPPLPAPALPLTLHDGQRSTLPRLLQGRVSAVQLMFTGCTATCPIQGALFAAVQASLPAGSRPPIQLLSLSIDALGDDAPALQRWLRALDAKPGWRAAVPSVGGVDALFEFLGGRSREPDSHTAQVYLFDAQARLVLRSADFPGPGQVRGWLHALAGR